MKMEQQLNPSVKLLNGFLRIMITCLVLILLAVPVALVLDMIGIL
ncbi:hypothetical protein ZONE111904_08310 [Zobellia nedashkovskayae]